MKNSYLHEVASVLKKWRKKIIYADDLKTLIEKIMWATYSQTKAYKLIYYLKNKWYLISIKKTIFYVKYPEDHISEFLILEDHYWQILHHHCTEYLKTDRYIGGLKALELNLKNFEVPEIILIVNSTKQSREMITATKAIHFKKYSLKKTNLFKKLRPFTHKVKMGKYSYAIANKELALLECMYNYDPIEDKEIYVTTKKIIKKGVQLDIDTIIKIIKLGKHHTSINRLYKIANDVNRPFAEKLAEVIKKYSFFLEV